MSGGGHHDLSSGRPGPRYLNDCLAFVYNVYTEPDHRRRGLGPDSSWKRIHAWCREEGIRFPGTERQPVRPADVRSHGLCRDAEPDDVFCVGVAAGYNLAILAGRPTFRGRPRKTPTYTTKRRLASMPFIITDPCIETKDTACVDVCPVDCIHPRKDEPEFAEATMLYIHPEECIDCGACVPACPVAAIYESIDATPSHQKDLDRSERDLPPRRCRRDGQGRGDRQGARRRARRHHGGARRPSVTARIATRLRFDSDLRVRSELKLRRSAEDSHLERQRHPGASSAGPGMDRARAPGRRLPAGNQGRFRSSARRPLRDGGLLVRWHGGKGYSGVALHVSKRSRPAPRVLPSLLRFRKPYRHRRRPGGP